MDNGIGNELYAWQVFQDGEWNIIGVTLNGGTDITPLVTTRPRVHEMTQRLAEQHRLVTGLPVRAVKFNGVEVLQEFEA